MQYDIIHNVCCQSCYTSIVITAHSGKRKLTKKKELNNKEKIAASSRIRKGSPAMFHAL